MIASNGNNNSINREKDQLKGQLKVSIQSFTKLPGGPHLGTALIKILRLKWMPSWGYLNPLLGGHQKKHLGVHSP